MVAALQEIKGAMLERKRDGIGGSDIGQLAGLSPFSGNGPHNVWMRIFGLDGQRDETPAMRRGAHLGPAICRWYADETGKVVTHIGRNEKTLTDPDHPLVRARPDGLVRETKDSKPIATLEAKSPGLHMSGEWGEPGTDEIPDYYIPQTIWEMDAAGVRRCDVVPLLIMRDGGLPIYPVAWDGELFAALYEIAEKFWRDYVVTAKPPPPDGSEGARELLGKLYPSTRIKDVIQATAEQEELLRRYADARRVLDEAEAAKAVAEQQLLALVGEHQGIAGQTGRFAMTERKGSPRWKQIAESLRPGDELIAQFTGQTIRYPRWTAAKGEK